MRSLGSGSSRARGTSSVAAASAAPCAARRGEAFSPIFSASASGSGSVPAANADGAAARPRMQKQASGRTKRPGKAKAIKPPMSRDTGTATGGAAAQRRLNEEAGIEKGERRRDRDSDSRRKECARRGLQCFMFDYEYQHRRV